MENNLRLSEHRKSAQLEEFLHYFETLLGPIEEQELNRVQFCNEPIVYIVGCARSGSTLIYQYLSHSGLFTYPTNFISRFYYAPLIGARLQKLIISSDFRGEIFKSPSTPSFESNLGKTTGPTAPHEFWYFWRRFFSFGDTQELHSSALNKIDRDCFIRELRAFQAVEGNPLVLKGMILNWHIPFLADLFPGSYFLYVKRSVSNNAK